MVQNTNSGGGKTLVNGAAYDISFGPQQCTITITGSGKTQNGSGTYAYLKYGISYYAAPTIITVTKGVKVTLSANCSTNLGTRTKITENGTIIAQGSGNSGAVYVYTVTSDITVDLNVHRYSTTNKYYSTIDITTG